ncbi:MAG: PadR family transcriptional regulator [Terracidiphilus sp.]
MKMNLGIWEIAVLATLREAPMHPYQMQRLLHERHKDEILVLKRGSLYHAIGRLERAGLIEAVATGRDGRRPERTTYRITGAGREQFMDALRKMVSTPRRESAEFMAAMSYLVHLAPEEAAPHLEERVRLLDEEIDRVEAGMRAASAWVLRINLIESEYLLAMLRAERDWARSLAADVREGRLAWNLDRIYAEIKANTEAAGLVEE